MDLQESLKQQIKEMNQFVAKQTNHVKNYQTELIKNIDNIDDKAMKGNLSNVQAIAKQLQNDFELKNKKENAD